MSKAEEGHYYRKKRHDPKYNKKCHHEKTHVWSPFPEGARCSRHSQLKRPRLRILSESRGPGEQRCSLFHQHIPETDSKGRWWRLTDGTFWKVTFSLADLSSWRIKGTCLDWPEGEVYSTRYLSGESSGGVHVARKDWWVTSDVTRLVGASGEPPVWCIKRLQMWVTIQAIHASILALNLVLPAVCTIVSINIPMSHQFQVVSLQNPVPAPLVRHTAASFLG